MGVMVVRRRRARAKRQGLAKVPHEDRRTAFPHIQAEGEQDCSGSNGANSTPRHERDASLLGMCNGNGTGTRSRQDGRHHPMQEDEGDGGDEGDEWTAEDDDTAAGNLFGSVHIPNSARDMRGGACVPLSRLGANAGATCGLPDVRDTGRVSGAQGERLTREQSRFSHSAATAAPEATELPRPRGNASQFPDASHSICHSPPASARSNLGMRGPLVEEDEDMFSSSSYDVAEDGAEDGAAEIGARGGAVLRDVAPPRRSNSFDRMAAFVRPTDSKAAAATAATMTTRC